jgi:xanthine dehydrogenase large subunit
MKAVGKPKSHESARGHVSGRAVYTDDQRKPEGMLSLWPVTTPHARARIVNVDVCGAYEIKGVVTVLTAEDVPGVNDTGPHRLDEVLLPDQEVSYWGQPVAWVVGTTEEAARLGAAKVVVDYGPLDPLLKLEETVDRKSFHSDPLRLRRGEPELELKKAEHVLKGEVYMGGQDHFYLETQVAWALPESDGAVHVYSSTQHPSETQAIVARVLAVPKNHVVVTCLRMGGGFGGKESQANAVAALSALAALKTGRPVRLRLRRDQDMIITGKRHPFLGRYEVGFSSRGELQALRIELYADGGWSLDLSEPVLSRAMFHADNAYFCPHMVVHGWVCKTNKTSQTAFRGFGGPQGMLVIEEILDRVARHLGLLPEEVRERNFYRDTGETNTTHYGQHIDDNRIARVWNEVVEGSDFTARRLEIERFNASSPHLKRGLAVTPVKFGISFTKTLLNQAGALVNIYLDSSIQVSHGGTEMGQGLHTKMLQVAAQSLGVPMGSVRVMPTSTDKVPNTSPTAASSGSDLNGQAVKNACETLQRRLFPVAAKLLGASAETLIFAEGWVFAEGQPDRRVAFAEVVKQAYAGRVSLSATGYYATPTIHFDPATGKGKPFYYFAYGAAASEVEVDGFTGGFKLRRVDIVHDVGQSLNPLVDLGQIEGGFVQGLGWLTCEELVWSEDGRLLTFAPSTYKIPTICEVPAAFHVKLLERAAQKGVIYGSKAVGEPPLMLALSVREAIRDAVASFAEAGYKADYVPLASPATPEAIIAAIERVREGAPEALPVPAD